MISIDRNPNPPSIRVYAEKKKRPGGALMTAAEWELSQAIAFFTDPAHYVNGRKVTEKKFSFKVYKDKQLAEALRGVFGGKCAYCETRYVAAGPPDVEHYRPKSEIAVSGAALEPGYYWLGASWTNLVLSCVHCNRLRHHEVPGQTKKVLLGKGTQFPLASEASRVRQHDVDVLMEDPHRLLLDPCADKPENHLTYDDQALIHPKPGADGQESAKGRVSIVVYALQRKDLVEARLPALNELKIKVRLLMYLVTLQNKLVGFPVEVPNDNLEEIKKIVVELKAAFASGVPYLAMLREFVRRSKQAGQYARLAQFNIDLEQLIV